jgi:hypothetical protein
VKVAGRRRRKSDAGSGSGRSHFSGWGQSLMLGVGWRRVKFRQERRLA